MGNSSDADDTFAAFVFSLKNLRVIWDSVAVSRSKIPRISRLRVTLLLPMCKYILCFLSPDRRDLAAPDGKYMPGFVHPAVARGDDDLTVAQSVHNIRAAPGIQLGKNIIQ